ncbi:uncharacterized protein PFL1_02087 [Pseudozyma flocculosa PF-1]|uniref:amidase n=1 Tax=Pseudozyma flocculosa TaxID=84751 RepID=A0A5C3EZE1_9BASI|nr:uncharacterized protein PFL1_02087 [Pseudozyma flocculosa PF-1]EPQ30562.1 hypothetical protein PFL1_02087 [Pseudozyma flocculosa PF-1]SPO37653.1 uncharacterized protein PSFLO_03129 [Pseudozyma flocculosa]
MTSGKPVKSFKNPSGDLADSPSSHVKALLDNVMAAKKQLGTASSDDYALIDRPFSAIQSSVQDNKAAPHALEDLVKAYARATVAASLATHCLTAFPWQRAIEAAQRYDVQLKEQKSKGDDDLFRQLPLLGLVFSVKDCINVEGHATTIGCSSRVDAVPASSAWIVQQLEDKGAIMIAKTACPQAMVSNVTHSPLWGKVRSPFGERYEVGGSSGGEAALVAMGGSALGLGTDMGGSVRQPASLTELFGLKFASDTFQFDQGKDFVTGLPDTPIPATAPGFLARHLSTIQDVCATLTLLGGTLEAKQSPEDGRLAVSTYEASPEVTSALDRLASDSDGLGKVTAVPDLLGDGDAWWAEIWMRHAGSRGFQAGLDMIGDDPLIPESMFNTRPKVLSQHEYSEAQKDLEALIKGLEGKMGGEGRASSDLILCPSFSYGGPISSKSFQAAQKAEIWLQAINLLDWPSISIPLPVRDELRQTWREQSEADNEGWSKGRQGQEVVEVWQTMQQEGLPVLNGQDDVWSRKADESAAADETGGAEQSGQGGAKRRKVDGERLPVLSVQLVARPGKEALLLPVAQRIIDLAQRWR